MQYLGIEYQIRNLPALDRAFIPFGVWASAYEKGAERPFKIAVERENGLVTVYETKLRGPAFAEANYRYAERCVKMLLWSVGGWRVYLCGDDAIAKRMRLILIRRLQLRERKRPQPHFFSSAIR